MATDKSEPRTALISGIALFVIVTLIGLRMVLQSYFINMSEAEVHTKILDVPPWSLQYLRGQEATRLEHSPMPIDQAMAALASGSRPAAIAPAASTDLAPMAGWSQMPRHVAPAAGPLAPNTTPQPAPAQTNAATTGGPTVTPGEAAAGSAFAPVRGDGGYVAPSTEPTSGPPQTTGTAHPGTGVAQPPPNASPVPVAPPHLAPVTHHAPAPSPSPQPNTGATAPGVQPAPSTTGGSTASPGVTSPSQ